MRVKFENNTLTVVTEVKKDLVADKPYRLYDDEGNQIYAIGFNKSGQGSITDFNFVGNVVVDNCVAFVQVMPEDMDLDAIKKGYGEALLSAATFTPMAAEEAEQNALAIDALFQ